MNINPWYIEPEFSVPVAQQVKKIAEHYDNAGKSRRLQCYKFGSLYENMDLKGLSGYDHYYHNELVIEGGYPITINRAQAVLDTLQAKIAALDEPRPQHVVTEGSYEQKRQAVWLDRWVEGQYHLPQGQYHDMWDMWRHAFLLAAAATGTAAVYVYPSETEKRVRVQLLDTLDMWVDAWEARYGVPRTYGRRYREDLVDMQEQYPDHEAVLRGAAGPPDSTRTGEIPPPFGTLEVCVDEVWRVARGESKGRHVKCVGKTVLVDEEWEYEQPPFVFFHFRKRLAGFWGASLMQTIYRPVIRENQIIGRMGDAEARSSMIWCPYDPAVTGGKKIDVPENWVPIPYDSKMGPAPAPFALPWFHQNAVQLKQMYADTTHEVSGMPEMQVNSRKDAGLDSGVAIRTVLAMLNERFAPKQRDIVHAVAVDTTTQVTRAGRWLDENLDGGINSTWEGEGFTAKVPGKDVFELPEEIYTVRVAPVSEKKNSPEDRIQLASELVQQKIITGGEWLETLQTMDTWGATKKTTVVSNFCNKFFDRIFYAPDKEIRSPGFYKSPPKYMDLDYAMALSTDAYLTALVDEVPESRRRILLQFLADIDRKITQRDVKKGQVSAMASGGEKAAPGLLAALSEGGTGDVGEAPGAPSGETPPAGPSPAPQLAQVV